MDKLIKFWYSIGIYYFDFGQGVMILVGLLLLWFVIKKGFELFLLVLIGVGGILVNIFVVGLVELAVGYVLYYGDVDLILVIKFLFSLNGDVIVVQVKFVYYVVLFVLQDEVIFLVKGGGYVDGILYLIYIVGLIIGLFLLLIFMGVGVMMDFGLLLVNL